MAPGSFLDEKLNRTLAGIQLTTVGRLIPRRRSGREAEPHEAPRALHIHREGDANVYVALREERRYTLGRTENCDIAWSDDRVSRLHAVLRHHDGNWLLHDLGSSNGTWLFEAKQFGASAKVRATRVGEGDAVCLRVGDGVLLGTDAAWIELLGDMPASARDEQPTGTNVSTAALAFAEKIALAAKSTLPVFLLGPSGSGKTHAAHEIDDRSGLSGRFLAINCARLSTDTTTLHSELLGHVKGAFTGASQDRTGAFQAADGGTLFLDEVESLPDVAQGFLLDILDRTGEFAPLGAEPAKRRSKPSPPTFRLISASKRPLGESGLRPDLCERLAEGHMWRVPTLDERREDIQGLIRAFLQELKIERQIDAVFTRDALTFAQGAPWPGQLRELKSAVATLVTTAEAKRVLDGKHAAGPLKITAADVRQHREDRHGAFGNASAPKALVAQSEIHADAVAPRPINPRALAAEDIRAALAATEGNKSQAAKLLGIARNTLVAKLRQFGLGT